MLCFTTPGQKHDKNKEISTNSILQNKEAEG